MRNYDVLICGASISGLYLAYALGKRGLSVAVVDRRSEIGTPVRCGEATGNRKEIERFIPWDQSYIADTLEGLTVSYNSERLIDAKIDDTGVILKRDIFEQYIAKLAKDKGAEIFLNTPLEKVSFDNDGSATGFILKDGRELKASYYIGADGAESFVGQSAGLTKPIAMSDAFSSLQYRVYSPLYSDKKMHFFIGEKTIPNGYIWVFPRSEGVLSVGSGIYGCHKQMGTEAKDYLEKFIETHFKDCKRDTLISGCAPLSLSPKKLVSKNVAIVGDAARMVNPLTAGGIMNALEAADLLSKYLLAAHRSGDPHKLRSYERKWSVKPRISQKFFLLAKELYLSTEESRHLKALRVAQRFFDKANRSKTFSIPITAPLHLLRLFLRPCLKRWRILLR